MLGSATLNQQSSKDDNTNNNNDKYEQQLRYTALAVGGAALSYYLYYKYFHGNKGKDKTNNAAVKKTKNNNKFSKSANNNKNNNNNNTVVLVEKVTKKVNMNEKLAKLFLKASEKAKSDKIKEAYYKVHLAISKLPYVIGNAGAPTGKEMGEQGNKHKVPSIGRVSGSYIDEYLRTGTIKHFKINYGMTFNEDSEEEKKNSSNKTTQNLDLGAAAIDGGVANDGLPRMQQQKGEQLKQRKKAERLAKHQLDFDKMFIASGLVVDLETTIPRKGSYNFVFEIGGITTNYDVSNQKETTFNCMVDFDLEQKEVTSYKDIENRLEELGQDAKFTLKFWKEHVLIPKFQWYKRDIFPGKLVESRKNWMKVIKKYGNGNEDDIPTTNEMMTTIKNEFGAYFFFPQKYALQTFLNYNLMLSKTMQTDKQMYWYAHNGNKFDFSVLEKACWRLNIGLNVKRIVVLRKGNDEEDKALFQNFGITANRNPIDGLQIIGFDTLQFARLKIKKGWKTKNKRAGHSQESLYARYTSTTPEMDSKPDDGRALEVYDAHNAVDDCIALLKLMKGVDEYLETKKKEII